jgi:hypothetical protein
MATDDISQRLPAAFDGRVESLFFDPARCHWGHCDSQGRRLTVREIRQPGDQDLAGLAPTETLRAGGQVDAVTDNEVPSLRGVAAVLRW